METQKGYGRFIVDGKTVDSFGNIVEAEKTAASRKTGDASSLPDDFPLGSVFEKLGFKSVADIQAKSEEELVALDGIGASSARKALAYGK